MAAARVRAERVGRGDETEESSNSKELHVITILACKEEQKTSDSRLQCKSFRRVILIGMPAELFPSGHKVQQAGDGFRMTGRISSVLLCIQRPFSVLSR